MKVSKFRVVDALCERGVELIAPINNLADSTEASYHSLYVIESVECLSHILCLTEWPQLDVEFIDTIQNVSNE